MTTYATLKTDIDDWMSRDDIATGSAAAAIVRMTEASIARKVRTRDMETRATLVVSSRFTALPSDYLALRAIALDVTNGRAVEMMTPESIREADVWANTSGNPTAYSIEGTDLVLAPEPTADMNVLLVYFAKYAALSADDDTNWLLTNHYDVYLWAALMNAALYIKKDNDALKYKGLFESCLGDLASSENAGRFSGSAFVSHGNPRTIV